MTNASNTPHDPYTPPPAPDASGSGAAPAAPDGVPPVPQAPFAEPLGYAPPPAAAPYDPAAPQQPGAWQQQPQQPMQPQQPYGYPGQTPAPVPASNARWSGSPQTSSIVALVAGAVSIFILPWFAGIIGIGMGVQALRLQSTQRSNGVPTSAGHTGMAIGGIVLGALGIVLKIVVDFVLS